MRTIHTELISIALFSLLILFSVACSRHPSDDEIKKDIQGKVAADNETKDSDVKVVAKDGKVTLTGQTKTPAAKQKIEKIAREEPGTVSVEDQTAVQETSLPPSAEEPVAVEKMTPAPPPPVEKPKPQPIVIPSGTVLTVRVGTALSSKTSQTGSDFPATLAQSVSIRGMRAIPAGSAVRGTVVAAKSRGKIKGEGELDLALISISVREQSYSIQTAVLQNTVKGKGKRTAVTTGGGVAGGALIGGLAGGGKGAGIGALLGGGAGLVGGAMTGNQQIEIPAESMLSFRLSAPLTLAPLPE